MRGSSSGVGGIHRSDFRIIGAFLILLILGITIILIIATTLGSSSTINETFGVNQELLMDTSSYSTASFQTTEGNASLYYFNNKPIVTGFNTSSSNYSLISVNQNSYKYVSDYLPNGSIIHIIWSASSYIVFNIIVGNTNFTNWKKDNNNGQNNNNVQYTNIGKSGRPTYLLSSKNDEIYFVFLNFSPFSVNLNFNFNFQTPTYDLTMAKSHVTSPNFQDKSINSNYILIVNNGVSNASFKLHLNRQFSSAEIFFFLGVVYAVFLILVGRKLSKKLKKNKTRITTQNKSLSHPKTQNASDIYGSHSTSGQANQLIYKEQHQPKYCKSCGSAVLQDALYCAECGSRI